MATVPKNFVTQREEAYGVSIQASTLDNAAGEVMWEGTTDGTTVVLVDSVDVSGGATDQSDVQVVFDRVDEAGVWEAE